MTSARTALIQATAPGIGPHLPVDEQAQKYARLSRSGNTLRAYDADWRDFTAWCSRCACSCLPATSQTVAQYIADLAKCRKASTIQRRLSTISQIHQLRGFESPTKCEMVRSVLKGIRRALGTAPHQKTPLVANDVREMVARLPDSLLGVRDCALLLLGFAGAFRRSELVGLNVDDLTFTPDGLIIVLRRSKTDQEGQGRKIGIPRLPASDACPVRAIQDWLECSRIADGPVFRPVGVGDRLCARRLSARAVALVIKRNVAKGRDASQFAGHSLRAGFVTSASQGGAASNRS